MNAAEALSDRLPTAEEKDTASVAVTAMAKALTTQGALPISVGEDDTEVQIELSPAVGQMVLDLLSHIARGEMVTFLPHGAELTTQEAADILNVSRPFLTKLLKAGEIAFHTVGTHRRIRSDHLLAYKARRDRERASAMKELQRLSQEYDAA